MRLPRSWNIVIVAFFALSLSYTARSALQIAMPFSQAEFGWSRSLVSLGGAAALVTSGLLAVVGGTLLSRIGARRVLAVGLVALTLGLAATAALSGVAWQFLVVYGGLVAVGYGLVSQSVVSTMIAWSFTERRGLATGIANSGATAGQLILLPVLAQMFASFGWRPAYLALGLSNILMLALIVLLLRGGIKSKGPTRRKEESASFRDLIVSPVFHALFWSYVICGFTTSGVIETHFVPYAILCGFPPITGHRFQPVDGGELRRGRPRRLALRSRAPADATRLDLHPARTDLFPIDEYHQ